MYFSTVFKLQGGSRSERMAWRDVRTFKDVDFTSKKCCVVQKPQYRSTRLQIYMEGKCFKQFQESQKHSYHTRVTCSGCGKIIDSDYKDRHAKSSKHIGQKLKFYPVLSASQTKLNFTRKEDEEPVAKGAKLDCDSSKDIIISSRCAADRSQEGKLNEI